MKDTGIIKGEPTKENGLIPVELGDGSLIYAQWIPNSEPVVGQAVDIERTAAGSMLATAKNSYNFNQLFQQSGLQKYAQRASWDVDFANGKIWNEPMGKPKKKKYQVAILGSDSGGNQYVISNVGPQLMEFNFPNWVSKETALVANSDGWEILTTYRMYVGSDRETYLYYHNGAVNSLSLIDTRINSSQTRLLGVFYHPQKAFISFPSDSFIYTGGESLLYNDSLTVPESITSEVTLTNPQTTENILVLMNSDGDVAIEKEANFVYRYDSSLGLDVVASSEVSFWLSEASQRKKINSKLGFQIKTPVLAGIGSFSFTLPLFFQSGYNGWINFTEYSEDVCFFSETLDEANPLLGVKVNYVTHFEDTFFKYSGLITALSSDGFTVNFTKKTNIDYDVVYEELNYSGVEQPVIYTEQNSINEFFGISKPEVSYPWGRHPSETYEQGLWLPYSGFSQTWGLSGVVVEAKDFPISWVDGKLIRSSRRQSKRLTEGLIYAEIFDLIDRGDYIDIEKQDELLECEIDVSNLGENIIAAWQTDNFVKKMSFTFEEVR